MQENKVQEKLVSDGPPPSDLRNAAVENAAAHAASEPLFTKPLAHAEVPAAGGRPGEDGRRLRGAIASVGRVVARTADFAFGGCALWAVLSLLATFPLLQLLSLGYLLEVSGRVARTGRLGLGFVGHAKAARWGSVALMAWLMLLAPRLIGGLAIDAGLIAPAGDQAQRLRGVLLVVCSWIVLHTAAAAWRGGRLRHFLWPRPIRFLREVTAPGGFSKAGSMAWRRVAELQLPHYFWLGLKGFVAGFALLALPTTLLAAGARTPGLGLLGAVLLAAVVVHLPLLQARLAATGRWRAGFNFRAVWSGYSRAPLLHAAAVSATLLLAAPLYVLKVELVPREAAWLPSLLFVASAWPARLLAGWAVARAERTPKRWWRTTLWLATLIGVLAPLGVAYSLIVFLTRYASWHGVASLYEQHAFLLPAPFLGY
ncbi:MAG: hypothetical protein AAGB00_03845 [Planctomycetota bacterium]